MTATHALICGLPVRHIGTNTAIRKRYGRNTAVSAARGLHLSARIPGGRPVKRGVMSSVQFQSMLRCARKLVDYADSPHSS